MQLKIRIGAEKDNTVRSDGPWKMVASSVKVVELLLLTAEKLPKSAKSLRKAR